MFRSALSRKFWYREDLAVSLSSTTTPNQKNDFMIDPRMLPLLQGKRVALIDDVISSGASIVAGSELLTACNIEPVDRGGHAVIRALAGAGRCDRQAVERANRRRVFDADPRKGRKRRLAERRLTAVLGGPAGPAGWFILGPRRISGARP